eukprot:40222-Eustigmatos_ZCMA.PRE.1
MRSTASESARYDAKMESSKRHKLTATGVISRCGSPLALGRQYRGCTYGGHLCASPPTACWSDDCCC